MYSECLADSPNYSTQNLEIQDYLRLSRLACRYGLTGPTARLIARLAYDAEDVR